jgi:hypothetical protein
MSTTTTRPNAPAIGTRVALHPVCDEWMQGDRYGDVVAQTTQGVWVRLDSGRVRRFHAANVVEVA